MTAPSTCGVAAPCAVELDDEVAVLAEHAVPRPVEAVHVVLEPVPQRDARDRQAVARLVEQPRQQLALLLGDEREVVGDDRRDSATPWPPARRRQVGVVERDATRRHVPAGVADGQLGEQHEVLSGCICRFSGAVHPRGRARRVPSRSAARRDAEVERSAQRAPGDDQERERPDHAQHERDHPEAAAGEHPRRVRTGRSSGSVRVLGRDRRCKQRSAAHARLSAAAWSRRRRRSRSAASTVLRSNIARVVGPDPAEPRRDPARDLRARLVDVGDDPPPFHRHARADDRRAGLHHVGPDDARRPGGRDEDVGLLRVLGQELRTGVAVRDRRVRVRFLEREQHRERPADREPAADDRRRAGPRSARGGARAAPGSRAACTDAVRRTPSIEPPEVHRVQAVGVLARDRSRRARLGRRDCFGSGSCTMNASTSGSSLNSSIAREHVGLGRGLGELDVERVDADLGRVGALAADVRRAVRVVADEDRAEPGRDARARRAP